MSPVLKILTVVGARPQFVKAAALSRYFLLNPQLGIQETLVHTGQHYDQDLSGVFFDDLNLPKPLMLSAQLSLDQVISEQNPDFVLAFGDTHSTLAAALAATQRNKFFIHVEAGERVFRRENVPEESNRIIADHLAALALTSTEKARMFLMQEGFSDMRCKWVGDPMLDIFLENVRHPDVMHSKLRSEISGDYDLATLHRPENTDSPERLRALVEALAASPHQVILPAHPRLALALKNADIQPPPNVKIKSPLGYRELLSLLLNCRLCITDSGGLSREAYFAGKLSLVPLARSWWSEIVASSWSRDMSDRKDPNSAKTVAEFLRENLSPMPFQKELPRPDFFGQGKACEKIGSEILEFFNKKTKPAWHRLGHGMCLPKVSSQAEFTHSAYADFLRQIQNAGYSFKTFSEVAQKSVATPTKQTVLLRHDLDFDPDRALPLAELEQTRGIRSTYFFLLRSEHYSVFTPRIFKTAQRLLKLGHEIGLHFDETAYMTDPIVKHPPVEQMGQFCLDEAIIMGKALHCSIEVVSFHRPFGLALDGDPRVSGGLPHTYQKIFQKEFKYFADSGGAWRFGSPLKSAEFAERKNLHILIHPIWWQETPRDPFSQLEDFLERSRQRLEISTAENCKVFRVGKYENILDRKDQV